MKTRKQMEKEIELLKQAIRDLQSKSVDWRLIKESQGKPKADFCEYWRCRKEERDAQRGEL